jgi:hypothetical protein
MFAIQLKERGKTPRKLIPAHNAASREGYRAAGLYYHEKLTPLRFTYEHGRAAGYTRRKGDDLPYGSKEYWKSYMGRKKRQKRHRDPFVWSGTTRARARRVNLVVLNKAVRLRYQVQALNWHPHLRAEWIKILPSELLTLGKIFDRAYNKSFRRRG